MTLNDIITHANNAQQANPKLRYGQCIYNALPDDIAKSVNATELDTFSMTDPSAVMDTLYLIAEKFKIPEAA